MFYGTRIESPPGLTENSRTKSLQPSRIVAANAKVVLSNCLTEKLCGSGPRSPMESPYLTHFSPLQYA